MTYIRRRLSRLLTSTALVAGLVPATAALAPTPAQAAPAAPCSDANAQRRYDVAAISVRIPYNRWGKGNPNGMVYVLEGDREAMLRWDQPLAPIAALDPAGNRRLRPRPLVLRANEGECVRVRFTNRLTGPFAAGIPASPRVSMHAFGMSYVPNSGDGANAGFNADTTVGVGQTIDYLWRAPAREGLNLFRDLGVSAGSESDGGSAAQGLYGGLAVEPAGSTWLDPVNGQPMYTPAAARSGDPYLEAMIRLANGTSFRESAMISQDELPEEGGFSFNYGAEPEEVRDAQRCPDCTGEETSLSSWPYGDPSLVKLASGQGPWLPPAPTAGVGAPAPDQEGCGLPQTCWTANVVHTYVGDPTKIRFGHAGVYETHVFHLHAHQWLADPADVGAAGTNPTKPTPTAVPESNVIDSQTYGPWETYTADLLYGSGSAPGTIGDSIFHCHLYPHFAAGFWALLRTHDVLETGTQRTPDGIGVMALQPLPGRAAPASATADNPGYPRFVPGAVGWRAPQPPLGITNGPDGPDEPRIVAGRQLTPANTTVEASVQQRLLGGRPARRGAPFRDPCPAGSREVTFNISAIQLDLVYNELGWHDTQARVLVPDEDIAAIRAGTKKVEPLFFRINQGDCINYRLTNRLPSWLGNDAFLQLVNTSMIAQHIHLVKFDVMASDGASNGWNYQEAAFSAGLRDFNRAVLAGTQSCTAAGCRMPVPAQWDPNNPPNNEVGQTYNARWYADTELGTVFTHDHHFAAVYQNRGVFGALIVEPKSSEYRNPRTGAFLNPRNSCTSACVGNSYGTAMDIVGPAAGDDFREFGIAIHDYVSLTKAGGNAARREDTIAPPLAPEIVPAEDPGVSAINYRNEPMVGRLNGDPSDRFNSNIHGDPVTPIFHAYSGDPIRIRLIQGAQEEQHAFGVQGARFADEPNDPQSRWTSAQTIGISEAFSFRAPDLATACSNSPFFCVADTMYGGTNLEDIYNGAWGIIREFGKAAGNLKSLPDRPLPFIFSIPNADAAVVSGGLLDGVIQPSVFNRVYPGGLLASSAVCPAGSPTKSFSVVAMQTRIEYGDGLNDPYGLVYAMASDEAAIRAGTKRPEPLVLRANEGDCIKVTLRNTLTNSFLNHTGILDGDAPLATEPATGTPAGLHVSMHPQGPISLDARFDLGMTLGFNLRQTVAPGASRTYTWFAPDQAVGEPGPIPLVDFGDVRGHRHHGLLAALVIEPKAATYSDFLTGGALTAGAPSANVLWSGTDFREHVVFYQDGLTLRRANGAQVDEPIPDLDLEDQGEVAISYGAERFDNRLGLRTASPTRPTPDASAIANVFSSAVHGDPATPILRAYTGDSVRIHVIGGSDRSRQHAFGLGGHSWVNYAPDPGSRPVSVQGGLTAGITTTVEVVAGGSVGGSGDHLYGDMFGIENLSGGSWGIFRVYPRPVAGQARTAIANPDNPYGTARPLPVIEVPA